MIIASAYEKVSPSFDEPEILMQYSLPSGFEETLAGGEMRVRLGEDDLVVYARQLNLRTKNAAAQGSMNELPGINIIATLLQTPTYLLKIRSEFDHHTIRQGNNWGFNAVDGYRLGMRQANFQTARDACFYGMNPQNGEGLLNQPGANALNLPPDSNGNTTARTYDNGQMAFFLASQVQQTKTRTLQMGIGKKFTYIGPQRILGPFEYNVVQLVQFQRTGAGTDSTKGTLDDILMKNKDRLVWCYDDTLIGKGAGGTDAVILIMPEVTKPTRGTRSTNVFADLTPGAAMCSTQYADFAAPTEIMSPMAGGATDFMMEWRITSGWVPRNQALTIISIPY